MGMKPWRTPTDTVFLACALVSVWQFDRGYSSPYFVTDTEKMSVEYDNCKVRADLPSTGLHLTLSFMLSTKE